MALHKVDYVNVMTSRKTDRSLRNVNTNIAIHKQPSILQCLTPPLINFWYQDVSGARGGCEPMAAEAGSTCETCRTHKARVTACRESAVTHANPLAEAFVFRHHRGVDKTKTSASTVHGWCGGIGKSAHVTSPHFALMGLATAMQLLGSAQRPRLHASSTARPLALILTTLWA